MAGPAEEADFKDYLVPLSKDRVVVAANRIVEWEKRAREQKKAEEWRK